MDARLDHDDAKNVGDNGTEGAEERMKGRLHREATYTVSRHQVTNYMSDVDDCTRRQPVIFHHLFAVVIKGYGSPQFRSPAYPLRTPDGTFARAPNAARREHVFPTSLNIESVRLTGPRLVL